MFAVGKAPSGSITPIDTSNIPSYIGFNGAQINTATTTNDYTYSCQLSEFNGSDTSSPSTTNLTYIVYCPLNSVPKTIVACHKHHFRISKWDDDGMDAYFVTYSDGSGIRINADPEDAPPDWYIYAPYCGEYD